MLKNWLSNLFQISNHRCSELNRINPVAGIRQSGRRTNLQFGYGAFEALEDRALLAAYIVDTVEDGSVAGDGAISLREAITAANTDAAFLDAPAGDIGLDTITFDPSLNGMTITLGGTALTISDSISISDSNLVPIAVDGGQNSGVFAVNAGDVSMSDITITGGNATQGGGIVVAGGSTLSLDGVTISGNTATGNAATDGGGGIYNDGGTLNITDSTITANSASGISGSGGGVFNAAGGTATINDAVITGNEAERAGGGIEDASAVAGVTGLSLTNVTLDNNSAFGTDATAPGNGGGLHVSGAGNVTISGGTVSSNFAALEGGGLWNGTGIMTISGNTVIENNGAAGSGADQGGGGIFNAGGTVKVSDAVIRNNIASGGAAFILGGDQENPAVTTSATGNANFQYNAINDTFDLRLVINGLALSDVTGAHIHVADAGANGPVIVNLLTVGSFKEMNGSLILTLHDIVFPSANEAALFTNGAYINVHSTANPTGEIRGQITFPATMGSGGGILNDQGTLSILRTAVTGNIASRAGGGIESNLGSVTIDTSSLSGNLAGVGGVPATPGNGGGLHITGAGSATLTDITVQRNFAASEGGGLWNGSGTMNITGGSVISGNGAFGTGSDKGGGGIFNAGGILNITDGLISNNSTGTATTVSLSGDQEVPAVMTAVAGTADLQYNFGSGRFRLNLFISGLELVDNTGLPEFTAAHIHLAGAGSNGPVIVNLLEFNSFVQEAGGIRLINDNFFLPREHVVAFLNGGTYINVHSSANASGEIRGQVTFAAPSGSGGGILNDGGTVVADGTRLHTNSAGRAGGAIETNGGTVTLTNPNIQNNAAGPAGGAPGNGGGIHTTGAGNVSITGGFVSNNIATNEGGGLWNSSTGTLTVTGTDLESNTAVAGGAIYQQGGGVAAELRTSVIDASLDGNTATGDASTEGGGAIFNDGGVVSVATTIFTANSATGTSGSGGAILNLGGGTLTVSQSSLNGNMASRAGGGLEDNASTTTILASRFSSNRAGNAPGNGGGVHLTGASAVTVHNSLFTENSAANEGGGLWNSAIGNLTIRNSTIVGNDVDVASNGGGVFTVAGGTTTLTNTIVAENTSAAGAGLTDIAGAALSGSQNNLIGDAASSGGLVDGTDGNIAGNTGSGALDLSTVLDATYRPISGSPVINAGQDLSGVGITTDIDGVARPQSAAFDIGVYEADVNTASGLQFAITSGPVVTEGGDVTFTVSINIDPPNPVSVDFTTNDSTAVAGSDFTAVMQTLTFQPGEPQSQTVTVSTLNDSVGEDREVFLATLSNPTFGVINNQFAQGTIDDNDASNRPLLDATVRFPGVRPTLSWQPVAGAASYEVWVGRVFPQPSRVLISSSMVASISFTPPVDLDPAFYRVWVRSIDSSGAPSAWSIPIVFEVQPTLVSPLTPGFDRRPVFEWNAIPFTSGYQLFIRTTQGDIIINNLTGTSYTPTEDLPQGPIRWWIRSSEFQQSRGYSAPGDFTFQTTVLTPQGTTSDTTPTFTWVQVANSSRYVVYIQNLSTSSVLRNDNVQGTSYTPPQPLAAGNYRVWIKAIDAATNAFADGRWSVPVSFSIAANVPADSELPLGDIEQLVSVSQELKVQEDTTVEFGKRESNAVPQDGVVAAEQTVPHQQMVTVAELPFINTSESLKAIRSEDKQDAALIDMWMADATEVAELLGV